MPQRPNHPPREDKPGFAALLRERTQEVHRAAERTGFIAELLHGRASRGGYALFLRNLHPAYVALERALAAARDPLVGAFADPRLFRRARLEADLCALAGADWCRLPTLPDASAYADAVDAAAGDPARLLAHAYARYLGDLSGGQILKPLLARTLMLGAGSVAFYDFPEFGDLAVPKAAMRASLDDVPTDHSVANTICDEAVAAFRHNIAVSEAVLASLGRA